MQALHNSAHALLSHASRAACHKDCVCASPPALPPSHRPVCSDSGSVVLYARPHEPTAASSAIPLPPSAADASPRLCLALAAGNDAAVAAGSARGGVAVWDAPTRRMTEDYAGQHNGERVNALSFVPLRPGWLYSAGGDGRVCLQVRVGCMLSVGKLHGSGGSLCQALLKAQCRHLLQLSACVVRALSAAHPSLFTCV